MNPICKCALCGQTHDLTDDECPQLNTFIQTSEARLVEIEEWSHYTSHSRGMDVRWIINRLRAMEQSLCMAICIIRNEAVIRHPGSESQLRQWADELTEESGIDFLEVLHRTTPHDEEIV